MNAEDIFIKFKAEFNLADNFKLPKVLSALKPASFTVNIDTISEEKALEFSGKAELPYLGGQTALSLPTRLIQKISFYQRK